eukprot:12170193-Alexandrium_andersonii.AAC.1
MPPVAARACQQSGRHQRHSRPWTQTPQRSNLDPRHSTNTDQMHAKQTDLSRETQTPARLHLRPDQATTGQPRQNPCCEWRQSRIRTLVWKAQSWAAE